MKKMLFALLLFCPTLTSAKDIKVHHDKVENRKIYYHPNSKPLWLNVIQDAEGVSLVLYFHYKASDWLFVKNILLTVGTNQVRFSEDELGERHTEVIAARPFVPMSVNEKFSLTLDSTKYDLKDSVKEKASDFEKCFKNFFKGNEFIIRWYGAEYYKDSPGFLRETKAAMQKKALQIKEMLILYDILKEQELKRSSAK